VTDGRTDSRAIAYTRYSIYAVARNKSAEGSVATAYMQIYGKCSKDVMSAKIYTDFTAFN